MARRLDDLKMLNTDRWKAHAENQSHADDAGTGNSDEQQLLPPDAALAMPTGGALFNLANPTNDGEFVKPYNRERDAQEERFRGELMWIDPKTYQRVQMPANGGRDWMRTRTAVPTSGDDFTSVQLGSTYKYRIPPTSVTRKQGDCQFLCCCGWRLTAAQWIWWLNFVCFCAHTAMIFVTLWMAYWRHGRDAFRDTDHMMIPIYRIRNIPTQFMLDNNISRWSPGWNLTSTEENSGLFLYENGMPVNFASLIIAFFATSAVFHFWALVMGAYERWWFWYWRQLDDGFSYWRWAEYSISASIMAMAMGITLGIREQYALAGIFMLTWATQTYGFLTEYISTPKAYVDKNNYKYPVGPYQLKKFADGAADYGVTDYYRDPAALKLISQTEWEADRPMYDIKNTPEVPDSQAYIHVRSQRTANWLRRMVPHVFGWFTMTSVWFILCVQLENAKRDISEVSDRRMPEWVDAVIYGSFLIFMSFALVQIIFQRLAPGFYWGTEVCYCILSLTAKMYLGWFLLINVIYVDGSTADEALSGNNEVR